MMNMQTVAADGAGDDEPKRDIPIRENKIIGFEDEELKITGYLKEETEKLNVISIIGIPGQGKTTLAWKIYHNETIEHCFPIRIWINISQVFNIRDIFLQILRKFSPSEDNSKPGDYKLAQIVRSCLEKERFLLVFDDLWSMDAWNEIKMVLPESNRHAKVLITSREKNVGLHSRVHYPHNLRFLDNRESWELLMCEVFGNSEVPYSHQDLTGLGYLIATKCDGVPLTIVVIGGMLADQLIRSPTTALSEWKMVSDNVSDALQNNEAQQRITKVVELSYNRLPDYLRECFLYMGVFPEDYEIPTKMLRELWISEGFILRKNIRRTLEESAEENLNDLISRNLIRAEKTNHMGRVKPCRVHDMIRAFCVAKSKEDNLFQEVKRSSYTGEFEPSLFELQNSHLLSFGSDLSEFFNQNPNGLTGPHVHSFLCLYDEPVMVEDRLIKAIAEFFGNLRILEFKCIKFHQFPWEVTKLIHLRVPHSEY